MKLIDMENPVRAAWLPEQGYRLDPSPYLSGAFEARKLLERLPRIEPLASLTSGHAGGIYNGPKFKRVYVNDPEHGVPFLGSTDMMEADFSWLPLLHKKILDEYPYLEVRPGTTLISCSGTIGRMAYARSDMDGICSSQHVMKVVPDRERIMPGYLNAFLQSKYGVPMITSSAYGAIIQHIESGHIADLPVPRFSDEVETRIHNLIQEAADLRTRFQVGVQDATKDLFESAGLPELLDLRWHDQPRDLDFAIYDLNQTTLRALNFAPRARKILDALASVPHECLGDICSGGQLSRGNRFKRVDSEPDSGHKLIGQRQGFWLRPEGRWVALKPEELRQVRAEDETIMVASQGTLGENEVYCRSFFVTGSWQRDNVYSEHFLRVAFGDPDFPGAYLFAFFRSEAAFRILRSMSTGGKQQDIHEKLRREIPIPECTPADRIRIAETVRKAYRDRDEADALEDRALALLDEAVREEAR